MVLPRQAFDAPNLSVRLGRIMKLRIDYVADIGNGWCMLGLHALRAALVQLPDLETELEIRPFEQYPELPPGGTPLKELFARVFGADMALANATREAMREWATELGVDYRPDLRTRAYNSFDAHRLLRWALTQPGEQVQLRLALSLFDLTFKEGGNASDHAALLQRVEALGLDVASAREALASGAFGDELRFIDAEFREHAADMLPAVFFDGRLVSQGSQSPQTFTTLLRVAGGLA